MKSNSVKVKHNKKRNTVFLYEALMKEITSHILSKDDMHRAIVVSVFKEHFRKDSLLRKELDLYNGILDSNELSENVAEKIILESKRQYNILDKDELFNEQTKLINKINTRLNSSVFSNFVGNYKSLATIAQIFGDTLPAKDRVILEQMVIGKMCSKTEEVKKGDMKPLDDLVYKTFIKKFNDKYGTSLLKEQKDLLAQYVMSFSDNGTSLKYYLNEELGRIKGALNIAIKMPDVANDKIILEMALKVGKKLDAFRVKKFDQSMLSELLKIQEFINEAK